MEPNKTRQKGHVPLWIRLPTLDCACPSLQHQAKVHSRSCRQQEGGRIPAHMQWPPLAERGSEGAKFYRIRGWATAGLPPRCPQNRQIDGHHRRRCTGHFENKHARTCKFRDRHLAWEPATRSLTHFVRGSLKADEDNPQPTTNTRTLSQHTSENA